MHTEIKSRLYTAEENIADPEDTGHVCPIWNTKMIPKSHCDGYPFIASASNLPSGLLYASEAVACQSPWKESYDKSRLY